MILLAMIIAVLTTRSAIAEYQKLKFEKAPLMSDLDGIECAIENYDTQISRGVKVDSTTGTCSNLTESWFSNQTHDEKYSYFKLLMAEYDFGPTILIEHVPYQFVFRSVVLYVKINIDGSKQWFTLNILANNDRCYHMSARVNEGKIMFTDKVNGKWGSGKTTSNPFTESKVYKVEVKETTDSFDLYVDDADASFYSFKYRLGLSACEAIQLYSTSDNAVFGKIQFLYPN